MKGMVVGGYIVENKLGEGGMGIVYTARHQRLGRKAVIKMVRRELVHNEAIAQRFENEANAAARIGHPGIVKIYDVGQTEDGSLYIAMELLEGESLQARLNREKTLSTENALTIITHCADALVSAHAEGIVHRDLKPDNIFLVPDALVAGGERAKLLDFGIAKLAGDSAGGVVTQTGAMMGTPHYMSPEQCRGAGDVDHRTDVYALGCILFQLLLGKPPFSGAGIGDLIVAHMTTAPPDLRELAPGVPEAVVELVEAMLVKDASERLGSASDLLAKLLALPNSPVQVTATPVSVRATPRATTLESAETMASAEVDTDGPTMAAGIDASTSTTLGSSIGQQAATPEASTTTRSRSWLAAAVGIALVGGIGAFAISRGGDGESEEKTASPAVYDAGQIDAAPKVDPALARAATARAKAWLGDISISEELHGRSYPWIGGMSTIGTRTILSAQLERKTRGKNQTLVCRVGLDADGNPNRLTECMAQFSDDHPSCKPGSQRRATADAVVKCVRQDNSIVCRTANINIATCQRAKKRWKNLLTQYTLRLSLVSSEGAASGR